MAQIKISDGSYILNYYGTNSPLQTTFSLSAAVRHSPTRSPEFCRRVVAEINAANLGRTAMLVSNNGSGYTPETNEATAAPAEREHVWRGLKISFVKGTWHTSWRDEQTSQTFTVSGASPQEIIEKITSGIHPGFNRLLALLPPEEQPAVASAAQETAPATNRILRPADADYSVAPTRRINIEPTNNNAEYAAFAATSTAKAYQDRCRRDAAFLQWANSQP